MTHRKDASVADRRRVLAGHGRSTYVSGADGQNSRLCRVQPPGAAREPPIKEISASFRPLPKPARAARLKKWRFQARAASAPRSPACSRDGMGFDLTDYRTSRPGRRLRRALWQAPKPSATDKAASCRPKLLRRADA